MNLKEITFIFENCDSITVSGKYIGEFWLSKMKECFGRLAVNHFGSFKVCEQMIIEIHRDADRVRHVFDSPFPYNPHSVFERLSAGDITSVDAVLENGETVSCSVPWNPDDEYTNSWQVSKISKAGHLYISIGEKSNFDEVFPSEEIDDIDTAAFRMDMMGIGDEIPW